MVKKTERDRLKALSILDLMAMKQSGEKISCLTAYDASFSQIIDRAGVDIMLVGDSLGMVVQGKKTTVSVSIDEMVYHTQCVTNARSRAFIVADLPFLSYASIEIATQNAAKLMQSADAQMVKLEGAHIDIIESLVKYGVPVCGHLGLLPQSINQLGAYKIQGKSSKDAKKILEDAKKIEQAGASLLVLECIPAELAAEVTKQLKIPVIGIGAGVDCDGQVLVLYDMLGISMRKVPKFCKNFMETAIDVSEAVQQFHKAVKQSEFPAIKHSF
ncbi:MAG: 3-methyl-2-oxobutanoate hydroxymethyltransferase [Methylococcales bacterium]|nr:3-methyl-2-oxobutanoate hydroxymethyltransferase [Methylococcales bacterium]